MLIAKHQGFKQDGKLLGHRKERVSKCLKVSHSGEGHQKKKIRETEEQLLKSTLREHAYDLTFKQLEGLTGVPAATACRFFKSTPGWRQCGKSTRPLLKPEHIADRAAWVKQHLKNNWTNHVDLDEKWFYVITGRGRLKMPAGVEKPRRRVKSKRFVAKLMVLTAVTRPQTGFNGVLDCWRVTKEFVYKKKTVYQGKTYLAGESRAKKGLRDGWR